MLAAIIANFVVHAPQCTNDAFSKNCDSKIVHPLS